MSRACCSAENNMLSTSCQEHESQSTHNAHQGHQQRRSRRRPAGTAARSRLCCPSHHSQPPGYSNASMACVMGEGLNCLQETHFCRTAATSTACHLFITSSWHLSTPAAPSQLGKRHQ